MWMLASEYGGLRPWEMARLTPDEENRIVEQHEQSRQPKAPEVNAWQRAR